MELNRYRYGETVIEWCFACEESLRRHYVTVERGKPVLLRGPAIPVDLQSRLIRKRASWICERLSEVNRIQVVEPVVTGSRLIYAGRSYFSEVRKCRSVEQETLRFTGARFVIESFAGTQIERARVRELMQRYYRERAEERLPERLRYWQVQTGLTATGLKIRDFKARWASCDARGRLWFNPLVMMLPSTVLDYVIVHELAHTKEKTHSKRFWSLVGKTLPTWEERHHYLDKAAITLDL